MIRNFLYQWLCDKPCAENSRTALVNLTERTGVYGRALTHRLNRSGYRLSLEALDKVLRNFNSKPGGLLRWAGEQKRDAA